MSLKKEFIILGAIVAGLLVYLLLRQSDQTHYELPQVPKIERDNVTRIEISQGERKIVLSKDNGQWRLLPKGYPVDDTRTNNALDTVANLTLTALASESGNYETYDLAEDKRLDVTVYEGEKAVLSFAVGKTAPSFRHTFVTLADDNRVFHAQENFRSKFELDEDAWRDKTVMRFDPGTIYQIALLGPDVDLSARKSQVPVKVNDKPDEAPPAAAPGGEAVMRWETAAGETLDNGKVETWLGTLSSLACDAFIEGKGKADFTSPLYTVKVVGNSEQHLSLFPPTGEDEKYPAVSSASDYPFYLPKWRAEQIMKKPVDLFPSEKGTD